jgi:hypothetical protein
MMKGMINAITAISRLTIDITCQIPVFDSISDPPVQNDEAGWHLKTLLARCLFRDPQKEL